MLSPDYLSSCTDEILALYDKLNDSIIEDLARRIVKAGRMTDTAAWQAEKLNQAGLAYEDALRRISEITGKSRAELERLFEAAGVESLRFDDGIYKAAGLNPIPLKQSPAMLQMLLSGMEKTRGELENLVRTTANVVQSEFIAACDLAYMQVSSGAFDYNTAICHAVDSAAGGGLRVLYPTGWSDHLDVAVRRAVLTGINQTCGKLQERRMEEMGCELVETTAHAGARESHAVWQGKVFSYDGKSKKYPDFRSSTGYGTGPGLMGWNCRHGFFPFFEGISTRAYSDKELRELDEHKVRYNETDYTDYEASQIQRKLERDIRAQKRMILKIDSAMKEAGSELKEAMQSDYNLAAAKLKKRERKLKDFLRQTGRLPDSARQQVSGFNRSQAQRAVHGAKKQALREESRKNAIQTLPRVVKSKNTSLQKELTYDIITNENRSERGIVPRAASLESVRVIAGYETSTNLRSAEKLVEKHGGEAQKWQKKAGVCRSKYKKYEIHWYEYDGKQYYVKLKGVKDR